MLLEKEEIPVTNIFSFSLLCFQKSCATRSCKILNILERNNALSTEQLTVKKNMTIVIH